MSELVEVGAEFSIPIKIKIPSGLSYDEKIDRLDEVLDGIKVKLLATVNPNKIMVPPLVDWVQWVITPLDDKPRILKVKGKKLRRKKLPMGKKKKLKLAGPLNVSGKKQKGAE